MAHDDMGGVNETPPSVSVPPPTVGDSVPPVAPVTPRQPGRPRGQSVDQKKGQETYIGNVKKQGVDLGKELLSILPRVGAVFLSFFIGLGGGGGMLVAKAGQLAGLDTKNLYLKSRTMAIVGGDFFVMGTGSLILRTTTKVVNVLAAVINQQERWSALKKEGTQAVKELQKEVSPVLKTVEKEREELKRLHSRNYKPQKGDALDVPVVETINRYIGGLWNLGPQKDKKKR